MKIIFDADFGFVWIKSLRKVHSQLCSILQGLGQLTSHMCEILEMGLTSDKCSRVFHLFSKLSQTTPSVLNVYQDLKSKIFEISDQN